MYNFPISLERMFREGYRPHAHGEWVDHHFGNYEIGIFGAALCAKTMGSNQRHVIIEL
nr:MAG TPA: hypothetical protein [Bacteriophage sp.]